MSLSDTIHKERYAQHGETSWEDTSSRVAKFIASAEKNENYDRWYTEFYTSMCNYDFLPGGRIITNAGKAAPYLMNCNTADTEDSRESIGNMLKDILVISGTGGGVGISFSKLRPKGADISTNGGYSSGPISFMHCADQVAGTIKTGGGRRAACMFSLSVYHPDIMEFLHEKLDLGKLNNANISVEIDNKFIQAVKDNSDWNLIWAGKVCKTVKAKEIWGIIVKNSWASGEPGILNLGYMREMSNSSYFADIVTTNPCGEQPLPPYEACCLGSINISNFVKEKNLDKKGFEHAIEIGIRFLDNVVSLNEYSLDKIKYNATATRRIGLGLTGLHYAMLKLGIKYASDEGVAFTEKVYEILRNQSYWVSTELAKEKGTFAKFDPDKYLKGNFIKTLPTKIRDKIRSDGMRNVCLNTQAPTGTTSIIAKVSSGIEPIFSPVYERTFWSMDEKESIKKTEIIADELFVKWVEDGKDISHFEGSHNISPEWHLAIQESAQRYIDSAVSKTINIPESYQIDDLSSLLLKYIPTIKGVTVYRDNSRSNSPLKPLDPSEYVKCNKGADDIGKANDCPSGICEL